MRVYYEKKEVRDGIREKLYARRMSVASKHLKRRGPSLFPEKPEL